MTKPISQKQYERKIRTKQNSAMTYLIRLRKEIVKHSTEIDPVLYCNIVNDALTAMIKISVKQDKSDEAFL